MTAVGLVAHQLTLTVGGVAMECQLYQFSLTYAADEGEKIYTACPGGVVTVPADDGRVATLSVGMLHDWADSGVSWELAGLAPASGIAFTLNADTDKPEQARTYTGTIDLPNIGEDWATRQVQRVELELPVTSIVGPTRYAGGLNASV